MMKNVLFMTCSKIEANILKNVPNLSNVSPCDMTVAGFNKKNAAGLAQNLMPSEPW